MPKRNGETWKSWLLADNADLSTGSVSIGRELYWLVWPGSLTSLWPYSATGTLGQLLIAEIVYVDCYVYGSEVSLVTEGARRE